MFPIREGCYDLRNIACNRVGVSPIRKDCNQDAILRITSLCSLSERVVTIYGILHITELVLALSARAVTRMQYCGLRVHVP